MIPIVYRYQGECSLSSLYCSLSSSVPRYLAYLGTWLASVSWQLLGVLEVLGYFSNLACLRYLAYLRGPAPKKRPMISG